LVRAFLARWGIVPEQCRVGEDEPAIRTALVAGLEGGVPDILLISGGASVGEHDFTRALLERSGFVIHVSKMTARPGKPLIVGQRGLTMAFGLPGNPLAHLVCLNLYVRAALETLTAVTSGLAFDDGVLAADLPAGDNPRETFWPARWRVTAGGVALTPLRWSSSGDLTSLASANALLKLSSRAGVLRAGAHVEFARICEFE
jgi:molybdopterin molybdotransferase